MEQFILSGCVALLASVFCIYLLRPLAIRVGFVDRPNARKLHEKNIPLIGGIVIFFGFSFAILSLDYSLQSYRGLLAGSALLLLMGVVDDFRNLGAKLRLFGQMMSALLLVGWGHLSIYELGNIFFLGNIHLYILAIPLTVFIVMTNLNAMNMVDGQDGLAGGIALTQTVLLIYLARQLGLDLDMHLLAILGELLIVFLCFNMRLPWRSSASIFLGDSGATFIAFLLIWFAIDISQYNTQIIKPITVLWVMAFPLFDLINVVVHRLRQGRSIFMAGRDHFHHVLHLTGFSATVSTLLLCGFSLGLGVVGILCNDYMVSEGWQFVILLSILMTYLLLIELIRSPMKLLKPYETE